MERRVQREVRVDKIVVFDQSFESFTLLFCAAGPRRVRTRDTLVAVIIGRRNV